jgi:hypothetical protein
VLGSARVAAAACAFWESVNTTVIGSALKSVAHASGMKRKDQCGIPAHGLQAQ